ncbi:hypothetical protein ER57_07205 [Smithella sp. SCADC]|jgi:hypothetical protein|nr:hypothetical protein ER57_07205 [Smithella sp. SCADC]
MYYIDDETFDTNSLIQGDILSNIHLLGAIHFGIINYITTSSEDKKGWNVSKPPDFADAMVLSHSCEISLENKTKLTSIILAPIRDINSATAPEKISELIETNIIDTSSEKSYLKYFYVEPNNKLKYIAGGVVDFSKCFSIRKNSYDFILQKKYYKLNQKLEIKCH